MVNNKCGDCALPNLHPQHYCPLFNEPIDIHDTACKKFINELKYCEVCGNVMLESGILYKAKDGRYMLVCSECSKKRGTCATCVESNKCDFETNPSSLPKVIMKEIRQGNMIAQQQIRNPDRIRETCQKNCSCWSEEFECLKQNGCCGSWKGKF